jgi:hypothetical protein
MNTKKQGDIGLGVAIAYFVKLGHTVSIPLTDGQEYDLIADICGKLHRVQVKTTSYKIKNTFSVSLTIKGGNRTGINKIKKLDCNKVDDIFIVTIEGSLYLIPVDDLNGKNCIRLGSKYEKYLLITNKVW